jgi:hypothetical protein
MHYQCVLDGACGMFAYFTSGLRRNFGNAGVNVSSQVLKIFEYAYDDGAATHEYEILLPMMAQPTARPNVMHVKISSSDIFIRIAIRPARESCGVVTCMTEAAWQPLSLRYAKYHEQCL